MKRNMLFARFLAVIVSVYVMAFSSFGQIVSLNEKMIAEMAESMESRMEIPVPDENVKIVASYPVGKPIESQNAPQVANAASVYASSTAAFSGQVALNGGQANTPAITRLIADDLTLIGTPPYSIGRFDFSMCNLNAAAVSARPRVRFYLNNAGAPGTNITGFSFNPITVPAGTCTVLFANVAPFSVTSSQMWAGMLFDNSGATATAVQIDSFGMGLYPVPDAGTSADLLYRTTAAPPAGGSFLVNNPGPGANINFSGVPLANVGWDFRAAATIASVVRIDTDPRPVNGTAQWSVTTTGGSITSLAPANFALAGTAATGSTVTSVVATNISPTSTNWTVTASVGTTTGTLGLNWANVTGMNTNLSNTLPFAGEVYNVVAPTAAAVNLSGRVLTSDGRGIRNVTVSITDQFGVSRRALSSQFGFYSFSELEAGNLYVVEVASKRFSFQVPSRTILLEDNLDGVNFIAE